MHIPDGYLDLWSSLATYALAGIYFIASTKLGKLRLSPSEVSEATALAALIFVAQMLNWPIPGGTSLHFVGGALAGIILGPFKGSLVIAIVLLVQCLVFHDGGITALGANIINMAIIDVWAGYLVYRLAYKALSPKLGDAKSGFVGGLIGGWLGLTLAGSACGVEIGLSPSFPYGVFITVPIMGGWHAALGVVEGVITGLVVYYLKLRHPEVIKS
ncbi:cobalamin (vitamin B12) biosynthesis CbiM protein [Thermogladius calderae 1633]|uniref:Cobalamin (Vitamin B12) biosynthesis CbiM protein n=1 Tax=Thermogladius calderae (strain DSM 22663 / VKM B-2946 / 1633) TaxID=1184251 RepID=I3TEM3_THEC1|nr:energy-coupling factor ABC transporter permease [Thermogladius calderae]AFK51211.1 cobalamin (vitamin B12) biosynthesis CbiM protein [Thermogladius calderae 1633]